MCHLQVRPHRTAARLLLTGVLNKDGAYALRKTQGLRTTLRGVEDRAATIDVTVWEKNFDKSLNAWTITLSAAQ